MKNKITLLLLSLISSVSYASTGDIRVQANVQAGCELSVSDADFGVVKKDELVPLRSYFGKFKIITNSLELQCSQGVNASITQDGGRDYDGNSNYIKGTKVAAQYIPYAVYTDFLAPSKYVITSNPGNITPSKALGIRALTMEKFSVDFAFALYFQGDSYMTYAPDDYKDVISYSVAF